MFSVTRANRWGFRHAPAAIAFLVIAAGSSGSEARAPVQRAPIADGVMLNIGLNCQWQRKCMVAQQAAMGRSLDYVRKARPASWRIHLCNRNAARSRYRIDWVGFDNCIRNASLRPAPRRQLPKRRRTAS